jgi:hypothetical protein
VVVGVGVGGVGGQVGARGADRGGAGPGGKKVTRNKVVTSHKEQGCHKGENVESL